MDPTDTPSLAALSALVTELRAEVRSLAERLAALESPPQAAAAAPVQAGEDDLLLIAAAVAAFLGVRARIRQVRLIQSSTWAQVGRATVHASHRVH